MIPLKLAVLALLASQPAADAAAAPDSVADACARSDYELDCGCVAETFDAQASGLTPAGRSLLARYAGAAMGSEPTPPTHDMETLIAISDRLDPIFALPERCPGGGSGGLSGAPRNELAQACAASGMPVDCACIVERFENQAAGKPETARQMTASVIISTLWQTPSKPMDSFPAAQQLQYAGEFEGAGEFKEICAVPDPAGVAAGKAAAAGTAPAGEAASLRAECESFGNASAYCGCHVSLLQREDIQSVTNQEERFDRVRLACKTLQ